MDLRALKSGFKKTMFSLVAILLGLTVALVIAEGILRLTRSTPCHRNALNSFHTPDPYLGWRGLEGFKGIFARKDFRAIIAFDDKGYRQKTSHTRPLPEAEKVVFLGDSFAWGWGVSQGELFSDVLQDLLGPGVDVINLGTNTFGTVQEWIQLEREVIPMKPAGVGVLVYGNDFEDNLNSRDDTRPYCVVEDGKVVLKNLPVAESIGGSVRSFSRMSYALTHLRFYHNVLREYIDVAKRRVKRWAKKRKEGSREHREIHGQDGAGDEEPSMEEAVTVFEHALGRMVELCRNGGVRLFVVYVPTGDNIASGRPEYEHIRIVQRACRRYDIPLVDLMPDFIAGITGKEGEPYYFTHDLHWTPEGHRLAADILFQRVFGGRSPETPNQPPAAAASGG